MGIASWTLRSVGEGRTLGDDTDLARQLTKDPFVLDFLDLDGRPSEQQLEDALMHRLERFMLELGRGSPSQAGKCA